MFRFGRNGVMAALLGALAIDSTERRRRLDADLAEQRQRIREERRAAEQAKREAEQRQRAARAERRRLLTQRVYQSLQEELNRSTVGQFKLTDLVGQKTIAQFAARVTSIVDREINRED